MKISLGLKKWKYLPTLHIIFMQIYNVNYDMVIKCDVETTIKR